MLSSVWAYCLIIFGPITILDTDWNVPWLHNCDNTQLFSLYRSGFKTEELSGRNARRRQMFSVLPGPSSHRRASLRSAATLRQWTTASLSTHPILAGREWLRWARCRWLVVRHCPCRPHYPDRELLSRYPPLSPWEVSETAQVQSDFLMVWTLLPPARPCTHLRTAWGRRANPRRRMVTVERRRWLVECRTTCGEAPA